VTESDKPSARYGTSSCSDRQWGAAKQEKPRALEKTLGDEEGVLPDHTQFALALFMTWHSEIFLAVPNIFDKDVSNIRYNGECKLIFNNSSCHNPRFPGRGPFVIVAVSLTMLARKLLDSVFCHAPTLYRLTTQCF